MSKSIKSELPPPKRSYIVSPIAKWIPKPPEPQKANSDYLYRWAEFEVVITAPLLKITLLEEVDVPFDDLEGVCTEVGHGALDDLDLNVYKEDFKIEVIPLINGVQPSWAKREGEPGTENARKGEPETGIHSFIKSQKENSPK